MLSSVNRIYFLILTVFLIFISVSTADARYFVITNYHSDIEINEDGTIDITETIEVNFEMQRHGIYREIPFRYRTEFGDNMLMPITVKSVKNEDGREWTSKVTHQGNVVNIRIGDADRYVFGRQVYVINYEVDNALLYFDDHDELYWNVTGNYWLTNIDSVSADVRLNSDKISSKNITACFTGRYGSNATDCNYESYDNGARFNSTRGFGAGGGMTVVFGWDKGIVAEPSGFKKFMWKTNLIENWVFLIPVFIFIFMFTHWRKHGRDPKVFESVTVQYEPPKISGKLMTPTQAGALSDERLNPRDLTAGIVGLAGKGFIEMKELEDDDYNLKLLKEPDETLTRFERLLIAKLFRGDDKEIKTSDLKNKFYKYISELKKTVFDDLVALNCFTTRPGNVRAKYVLIGIAVLIGAVIMLALLSVYSPFKGIIAGILSGFSVIGFANAMPVKTRTGAKAKTQILGFLEFMTRADKDRIKRMGPSLFYEYLPYAIALDVVDSWTRAFEGLLSEPPSWFIGQAGLYPNFSAHRFSESLTSATSHLGDAMFSAPRGSGSSGGGGGGGFSGGGGGGGGGGSW